MTLDQFQSLRMWHLRHWQQHPVEKHAWEGVLTLWMTGWVGGPAALVLELPWVWATSLALLCLPSLYVTMRERMHRNGRLRCDWITLVR